MVIKFKRVVINFITLFFVFYLHIKNKLYKFAYIILKLNDYDINRENIERL